MNFLGDEAEVSKYTEDDLETYFNLNITLLSIISIFVRLNGKRDFDKFGVLTKIPILTIVTVIFSAWIGILQVIWCLQTWSTDTEGVTIVCTLVLSNLSCFSKACCLMYNKGNLQHLLDNVSKMWNDNRPTGKCRENIIRRAKSTVIFVKVYIFMTIGLITTFGLPPLEYMLSQYLSSDPSNSTYDYSLRVFVVEYPFNVDTPLIYWSLICEEFWILFGLSFCWVTGDTLFASLTTQLSIQFEILENDIHSQIRHEIDEKNLKKNLIILVHRHRTILSTCKEIERIFSPIFFINVIVSSIIICVNTFILQEKIAAGDFSQAGYHLFLMMNTLMQTIVYCVFAETLSQTSLSIFKAVYDSGWVNKNPEFKICIHILLMNTQNPFYCSAYGFFTLTHQQLTRVINTALSYYMMLRTTSQ